MYDWLSDALRDSSQVVTASRRLARALNADYAAQQVAAGKIAWRSPTIMSLQDWLGEQLASVQVAQRLPTRINGHQSQILWERCLAREISDPLLNLNTLVRQARDTWVRMHEWNVSIAECEQSAQGQDQRIFARSARHYQSILDREFWIDDSGLAELVVQLLGTESLSVPGRVVLGGFDRLAPQVQLIIDALRSMGCIVEIAPTFEPAATKTLHRYENADAEMRAAGAWARCEFGKCPEQSIAIIASDLDRNSDRSGRLVREGLTPGWQYSGPQYASAVNVSYGASLANYPACAIAMLVLRWLHSDLGARDISLLLRSAFLGSNGVAGRARLELILRQLPDRNWSPKMLLGALQGRDGSPDSLDWLRRIDDLSQLKDDLARLKSPSEWAVVIDELLLTLNWPGEISLDSLEFQLVNRWRDLLNDFARLELVSPQMTFGEVLRRLTTMVSETIFQPESPGAVVHLIGPLEAAGMRFDRLWVCGVTAANWPPASRALALISRELQRSKGMPDAEPKDTMEYAKRVLARIGRSADKVVFSYPQTEGDVEQSVTALLADYAVDELSTPVDPGWHAASCCASANTLIASDDPVPEVTANEAVSGGATTIQRQLIDPFAAFTIGRLGVRTLQPISNGLSANLRGSMIHDALHRLYAEQPSRDQIKNWDGDELQKRINVAVQSAFRRHERYVDPVLAQLLLMERQRVSKLLEKLVAADVQREAFRIAHVEWPISASLSGVRLDFRIDRIDQLDDGSLVILDYKTGTRRPFLDRQREPVQIQLVVYAHAVGDNVAGLGLVNIDSRLISFDGAGKPFSDAESWDEDMLRWKSQVDAAAAEFQRGDVRINMRQGSGVARPLCLLSRVEELRHDG